jgi:glycosyltransferase involved in cell wall biosynthesis
MRIAYILTWNLRQRDGVTSKVEQQVNAWRALGHEVEVFCASYLKTDAPFPANIFQRRRIWNNPLALITNRKTYRELCNAVRDFNPDVNYLRWEFYKSSLARLMLEIPTCIELNAIYNSEFKSRAKTSIVDRLRYLYYLATGAKFEKCAAAFIGVTQEILDNRKVQLAGMPTMAIPNSTNLAGKSTVRFEGCADGLPRVVYMIGADNPWHGVDDVLKLAEQTKGKLEFDLVAGYEPSRHRLPVNVQWHSFLNETEFQNVFRGASCGLGTAGLHTKDMEEACPLKVRDYLAAGLPVILPYEDTAFLGRDTPDWVLKVPNNPGGILVAKDKIMDFVNTMTGRRISLEEVSPYVGSEYWEGKRMAFLQELTSPSLKP